MTWPLKGCCMQTQGNATRWDCARGVSRLKVRDMLTLHPPLPYVTPLQGWRSLNDQVRALP